MKPTEFVFTELHTEDAPKARSFYAELLGSEYQDVPGAPTEYALIRSGGQTFGGIAGGAGVTGGGTIDDVDITDGGTAGTQPGLELDTTTGTFNVSNFTVSSNGALIEAPFTSVTRTR